VHVIYKKREKIRTNGAKKERKEQEMKKKKQKKEGYLPVVKQNVLLYGHIL
jgi:hypothetical protein